MNMQMWIRKYWWILALAVAIFGFLSWNNRVRYGLDSGTGGGYPAGVPMMVERGARIQASTFMPPIVDQGISESKDRLVIEENSVSLLVKDVEESADKIQRLAEGKGGFLVSRNIDRPTETTTGSISVRVPAGTRDEVLNESAAMAVRVVSESVWGDDVTAQYEDLDAKLAVLLKTKAKLEVLLDQASSVTEILEVQRELNNLQYQIDALQGQKDYLAKAASYTKITVYLATDELALPHAPDEAWRPQVIFKQAVRELVRTLRQIGSGLIWLVVFSPILIVLLILWFILRMFYGKKKN